MGILTNFEKNLYDTIALAKSSYDRGLTDISTLFNGLVDLGKAVDSKPSIAYVDSIIINTFGGTSVPDNTLGKDGDIYKQFPSDTPVIVMDELSSGNYDAENLFEVFYAPTSPDLWQMKIGYKLGVLLLKYGSNGTPDEYNYTMQIDGGTVHDLMLYNSNSQAVTLKFPVAANADIASITTTTNIRIASKQLTGKVVDYVKYSSVWFSDVVPYSRPTSTVEFANSTPSKAELITAFDSVAHHDYAHSHDFYVKNTHGEYAVDYHPNGDVTSSGTNYKFYFHILDEAV